MGWGDPGFNGNKIIQTPNLDAMAHVRIRFTRFYAGGPVCSPTRGTCMTGRHYFRYGITHANEGFLPKQEISMADMLKASGYTTGHFGKWHLGSLSNDIKDGRHGGPDMLSLWTAERRDVRFADARDGVGPLQAADQPCGRRQGRPALRSHRGPRGDDQHFERASGAGEVDEGPTSRVDRELQEELLWRGYDDPTYKPWGVFAPLAPSWPTANDDE